MTTQKSTEELLDENRSARKRLRKTEISLLSALDPQIAEEIEAMKAGKQKRKAKYGTLSKQRAHTQKQSTSFDRKPCRRKYHLGSSDPSDSDPVFLQKVEHIAKQIRISAMTSRIKFLPNEGFAT